MQLLALRLRIDSGIPNGLRPFSFRGIKGSELERKHSSGTGSRTEISECTRDL